jgi:hypothetical protein
MEVTEKLLLMFLEMIRLRLNMLCPRQTPVELRDACLYLLLLLLLLFHFTFPVLFLLFNFITLSLLLYLSFLSSGCLLLLK